MLCSRFLVIAPTHIDRTAHLLNTINIWRLLHNEINHQTNLFIKIIHQNWSLIVKMGPSCSWSYGSWNYNYLMQSVHVTTNVVSSSPVQARCTQYTCGRLVFLPGTPVSSTNKTDRYDRTEILLKVASSIINQTKSNLFVHMFFFIIIFSHFKCKKLNKKLWRVWRYQRCK